MPLSKEQTRLLLKHEKLLGTPAREAARRINTARGAETVSEATAIRWFDSEESFEDQPRAGRPREVDREAVLAAIEESPSLTTRMLADGCVHGTIENILHEAGKVWKKTRWVPQEMTAAQKRNRVAAAQRLLERQETTPFSGALDYRR